MDDYERKFQQLKKYFSEQLKELHIVNASLFKTSSNYEPKDPLQLLVDIYTSTRVWRNIRNPLVSQPKTPSEYFLKERVLEFDKTVLKLACFYRVALGNHKEFSEGQDNPITQKSFGEFQNTLKYNFPTTQDKQTLILLLIFMGIERVDPIIQELRKILQTNVSYQASRKEVLAAAMRMSKSKQIIFLERKDKSNNIFDAFAALNDPWRDRILPIIECDFNFAQFLQGENLPGNLSALKMLKPQGLALYEMYSFFYISGSSFDPNNFLVSRSMNEPTYRNVVQAGISIRSLSETTYLESVYDHYLKLRGDVLNLDVHSPLQRALIRICCMSRINDLQTSQLIVEAFKRLPYTDQQALRKELNASGTSNEQTSILLYYGPSFLLNALTLSKGSEQQIDYIHLAIRLMLKIYRIGRRFIQDKRKVKNVDPIFTIDISDVSNGLSKELLTKIDTLNMNIIPIGNDVGKVIISNENSL